MGCIARKENPVLVRIRLCAALVHLVERQPIAVKDTEVVGRCTCLAHFLELLYRQFFVGFQGRAIGHDAHAAVAQWENVEHLVILAIHNTKKKKGLVTFGQLF